MCGGQRWVRLDVLDGCWMHHLILHINDLEICVDGGSYGKTNYRLYYRILFVLCQRYVEVMMTDDEVIHSLTCQMFTFSHLLKLFRLILTQCGLVFFLVRCFPHNVVL